MRRALRALTVGLVLLTCKDATGPVPLDRIVVTGPSTIYVGRVGYFFAFPLSAGGDTLDRTVAWSSSDTTVALITSRGITAGRSVGDVTITASADDKVATAPLAVRLVPVARVDVTPQKVDSLFLGDSLQLQATPQDSAGTPITDRLVSWATSDTAKATVSASGLVRARGPGSFTVTATSDGAIGGIFLNAQLRVASLAMPESLTLGLHHQVWLLADLRSASGTRLARPVTWLSSDSGVVGVSDVGVLTPHLLGRAVITARTGEFADSTAVTVVPEPVARIVLAATRDPLPGDATLDAFIALAFDSGGQPVEGRSLTWIWTSSDTTIARVRPNPTDSAIGQVTTLAPGTAVITVTADGVSGSNEARVIYGPARLVAQPDSMLLAVGQRRQIFDIGFDRFGNHVDISGHSRTYTIQDTAIARMDYSAFIPFVQPLQPGRTTVIVQLSIGLADTVPVIVPASGRPFLAWAAEVVIEPWNYSSWTAVLEAFDSAEVPSTGPRDVRLVSSDTTIVVGVPELLVGMTAAETVTVQGRRAGVATLTAITDSAFAILNIKVNHNPPAVVQIEAHPSAMTVGDTLRLHATVSDVYGVARPYPLTWSTTDSTRATVSESGLVSALGVGDVAVVASSGAKSDTVALPVVSPNGPAITEVRPTLLHPGDTATLFGTGFSPDQSANTVLIEGNWIPALSATDSTLTIALPPIDAWTCAPTHPVRVLVNSGGRITLDSATITVGTPSMLAVGQTILLARREAECIDLEDRGTYDLLVANASEGVPAAVELHFMGVWPAATPPLAAKGEEGFAPVTPVAAPSVTWSLDSLRRAAAMHRQLLERSRTLAARAGPAPALLRAARRLKPQLSVTATINGIAEIRIPRLEDPNFCASYRSIRARVVYAGEHALILEDVVAPLARQMDSYYQALGQEFDNVMYPQLLENFGNPLALDSLLDRDGRIAMVFSPLVNSYGVGGFVVSCDFYPESVAPSSNTGEVFYAQAPTGPLHGFTGFSADVWRWLTRTVVMHEAKHLTAFAERLSRGAPLEDTWLEEASAVLAEELWSRGIYGTTWRGDATYRQTLYCDVRPGFPECPDRPYSMFNAFAFLYDYALRYDHRTPLGPMTPDDASFYGSGWAFLRWTIDQHATSESAFLKALVTEASRTGAANLEARTGRPFGDLLPRWGMALYMDAWSQSAPEPTLSFPSWKLEDVFIGMAVDFPDSFLDGGHPLRVRGLVNDFPYQFAPGGWVLFSFGGYLAQALVARGPGGAPLAGGVRLYLKRGT